MVSIVRRMEEEKKHFKCDFPGCGKRFIRNYNVQVHMRTHTGEQPFQCPIKSCGEKFRWRSTLRTHYSTAHQMDLPSWKNCLVTDKSSRTYDRFAQRSSSREDSQDESNSKDEEYGSPTFYTQFAFRSPLQPEEVAAEHGLVRCTEKGCEFYFNTTDTLQLHLREHKHSKRDKTE